MLDLQTLNRLIELGSSATHLRDDRLYNYVAVNGKVERIAKLNPKREHVFRSLEGFLDYLNSDKSGSGPGIIFVGEKSIVAELDYMSELRQTAALPLAHSEEYLAAQSLFSGLPQKALWRLLLTKLDGCISNELLLQISSLNVKIQADADLDIQRTGLENSRQNQTVRVTFNDPKGKGTRTAEIETAWSWVGRIWEAWDHTFEIETTMEIESNQGVQFVFHPKRLETTTRNALLALVSHVQEKVQADRFTVYEGTF
jgi:hypothetical protein